MALAESCARTSPVSSVAASSARMTRTPGIQTAPALRRRSRGRSGPAAARPRGLGKRGAGIEARRAADGRGALTVALKHRSDLFTTQTRSRLEQQGSDAGDVRRREGCTGGRSQPPAGTVVRICGRGKYPMHGKPGVIADCDRDHARVRRRKAPVGRAGSTAPMTTKSRSAARSMSRRAGGREAR